MFSMLCYTFGQMNGEDARDADFNEGAFAFAFGVGLVVAGVIALLLVSWIHSKASAEGVRSTLPWEPSRTVS